MIDKKKDGSKAGIVELFEEELANALGGSGVLSGQPVTAGSSAENGRKNRRAYGAAQFVLELDDKS